MTRYKAINLIARPTGEPISDEMFDVVEQEIPQVEEGQFLVKQTHMSLDPAMFGWMSPDTESYIPPVELGTVMRSSGIGEVVASKHSDYAVGDRVTGMMGWTEYYLSDGTGPTLTKVTAPLPDEAILSIFALPGLTATKGLFSFGHPKKGETLVVSGGAGSVGVIVGQLAKAEGLTVVGVVGNDEKASWVVDELGFDGAINYKTDDLSAKLEELTPNGIDIYFENTGGPIQHHVFERMNAHGRIVVCGLIADYAKQTPDLAPSWLNVLRKRITIQGFTMPDHYGEFPQLLEKLAPYVMQGQIKYRAHVLEGLTSAINGLNLFFTGQNNGKLMVKL